MDEQDFTLLQVLGRTRNITHAADELYITQSSVSKRIRQMERELGLTLLLRSRQGIQFTPSHHGYPVGRIHGIPDRLPPLGLHNAVK